MKRKVVSKMTDYVQFVPISRLTDWLSNNVIIQVAKQRGILSGKKNQCTDRTCDNAGETNSSCANGNCTTTETPSTKRPESISTGTASEGRKTGLQEGIEQECICNTKAYLNILCNQALHLKLTAPCLGMNFPVYHSWSQKW